MKRLFTYATFFIILTTFSANIFAWDDAAHKLTAYVAWQTMTPQAREKAVQLLLKAPEDSQIMALYPTPPDIPISTYPVGTRSKESKRREFFMICAYWADIVRERDYPVRYKYHRATWHYLNTFWRENNGAVEIVPELKGDKENIVERLFYFDKLLRAESLIAKDAEKAVALAWVLHLAGDVHQPLHASGRVTELEPKGDQGGNLFSLSPKDTPRNQAQNLHWYWDSIVVRNILRKNDASDAEYLLPIGNKIMKKYPLAAFQSDLKLGAFDQWQQESFRIASTKVFPASLKRGEEPAAKYRKEAYNIAERQIAVGGYRLGSMLNQIFGQN